MKSAVVFPRVFLAHPFQQKGIAISMPKIYYPPPILEADKKTTKKSKNNDEETAFYRIGAGKF